MDGLEKNARDMQFFDIGEKRSVKKSYRSEVYCE